MTTSPEAAPAAEVRETLTHLEWIAAAEKRYGADTKAWRFRCPICKIATSVREWKDAKAPEGAVAFSCIGRFLPDEPSKAFGRSKVKQPCDYAGGGLFALNPVDVRDEEGHTHTVFDFADQPLARATQQGAGDVG